LKARLCTRQQIAAAMRGARVQLERRLDGSTWMHWRKQMLALEPCPAKPRVLVNRPIQRAATTTAERSAQEKVRARQRFLDGRRQWNDNYGRLPNRPIWQAMRDSSPQTGGQR